jgi:hypothetical protein
LELFCFLFCNTEAFGNLKAEELEKLLPTAALGRRIHEGMDKGAAA